VISVLTLFIVIAASRPVNKNVNTGAVVRAKRGIDRAGVQLNFINYWRTIKPVVTSSGPWAAGTEKSDLTLPFLNALTNPLIQACSVTTKLGYAVQQ